MFEQIRYNVFDHIRDTVVVTAQLAKATEEAYDMTYTPVLRFCAIILPIALVLTLIVVHYAMLIAEYILTPLFDICGLLTGEKIIIFPNDIFDIVLMEHL